MKNRKKKKEKKTNKKIDKTKEKKERKKERKKKKKRQKKKKDKKKKKKVGKGCHSEMRNNYFIFLYHFRFTSSPSHTSTWCQLETWLQDYRLDTVDL